MSTFKNIIICIVIFFTAYSSYSQNTPKSRVSLKWSKEYPLQKNYRGAETIIVGKGDSSFFTLNSGYLTKYNNDLTQEKTLKLKTEDESGKRQFEELFFGKNDKAYFLTSQEKDKEKMKSIYLEVIDKNALKSTGSAYKLAETPYNVRDYHRNVPRAIEKKTTNEGHLKLLTSNDSSKHVLMLLSILDFSKNEKEKFSINVFDENMKPLWNNSVALPYDDELFEIALTKVSNDGAVYIVGKIYNEKADDSKKGKPNYKYVIYKYSKTSNNPEIVEIDAKDKFINNLIGTIDANGDFTLNGFYSNKEPNDADGIFFLTLDAKTNSIKVQNYQKFKFIKEVPETKKKKDTSEDYEYPNMVLKEVIKRDDGNTILISEIIFDSYTTRGSSNTGMIYHQTYFYSIYVISMNPKGEINWSEQVHKYQVSNGVRRFMSYGVIINDKIHLVFNDDVSNLKNNRFADDSAVEPFTGEKNSAVVMVSFDDKGKFSEKTIFLNKKLETRANPRKLFQISPKNAILPCIKGDDEKFASIRFIDVVD